MKHVFAHRYVCSRFYIHNPPGADGALHHHQDAPSGFKEMAEKISEEKPEVNAWACVVLLVIATAFMSVTAEFVGALIAIVNF